jgi:hypothetical protein
LASTAASTERSNTPLDVINGDWVLLDSMSGLRVSNGGAISYHAYERSRSLDHYRIVGARGPVVDLEADDVEGTPARHYQPPPFARRAQFLVVSDGVGLFTSPNSPSQLAFRPGPVQSTIQGRYELATALEGVAAIDVKPRVVTLIDWVNSKTRPSLLPVAAASESAGPAASIVLIRGSQQLLSILDTTDGKTTIEFDSDKCVTNMHEAHFQPATRLPAAKQVAEPAAVLPSQGNYEIEGLGEALAGRIEIHGAQWKLPASDGIGTVMATATMAGHIGARLGHVHLTVGASKGVWHLDLRPIDGGAFLVSGGGGEYDREKLRGVGLMFRAGAMPTWAPSFGLEKDIDLLCSELGGLGDPVRAEAVDAAILRVGTTARSDTMRRLCAALLAVDSFMRFNMIPSAFRDLGRPVPACSGIEKLRHVQTSNAGQEGHSP